MNFKPSTASSCKNGNGCVWSHCLDKGIRVMLQGSQMLNASLSLVRRCLLSMTLKQL